MAEGDPSETGESEPDEASPPLDHAPEILNGEIIEETAERAATRVVERAVKGEIHLGPLPRPADLAKYEEIIPGLANRIVAMAELEQGHRHQTDDQVAKDEVALGKRGLNYALAVALAVIAATLWLGLAGKTITASILGGGELVALVTVFIVGRRYRPGVLQARFPERE